MLNLLTILMRMKRDGLSVEMRAMVNRMPLTLQGKFRPEVMQRAIDARLIRLTEEGEWVWLQGNKTLLAYFCGRMWCDDESVYSKRTRSYAWLRGQVAFPGKEIETLCGKKYLRVLRRHRIYCPPPAGFELVDQLFDEREEVRA